MFKVARPHVKQFSFGSKKYCKLTASISNQSGIAAEYYFKGRNFPDKKKTRQNRDVWRCEKLSKVCIVFCRSRVYEKKEEFH